MRVPTINRELLSIKIMTFFWWGGGIAATVYIPAHMAALGLRVQDITMIHTFLPLVHLVGPPVLGMVADKVGSYRTILLCALILSALSATGFVFVPSTPKPSISVFGTSYSPEVKLSAETCSSCNLVTPLNATQCELRCPGSNEQTNASLAEYLVIFEGEESVTCSSAVFRCPINCTLNCPSALRCTPSYLSIWTFFVLRIMFELFSGVTYLLMESSALLMVAKHNGQFGRQRFWGVVGQSICPLLGGYMVEQLYHDRLDYSPIFYLFDAAVLVIVFVVCFANITITHSKAKIWTNLRKILTGIEIYIFLVVIFVLGTLWGVTKIYVLWFMTELNSPKYLIGLSVALSTLIALPLMHYGKWFVGKMGHVPILVLGLFFYCIRFVSYSYIFNSWLFLATETLDAVTYHFIWMTVVLYASLKAPKELTATILGITGSIHYGVGIGSGGLLGGLAISFCGVRPSFQILGGSAALTGGLYALFYFVYLRRTRNSRNENDVNYSL